MNCWVCNHELIWGGDHDLEDELEISGHSIITNLSCPNKSCGAYVEVYHGRKEENTMSRSHLMNHLVHLKDEVNILRMRLKPSATGHIHTTIGVLEERIKEVEKELKDGE